MIKEEYRVFVQTGGEWVSIGGLMDLAAAQQLYEQARNKRYFAAIAGVGSKLYEEITSSGLIEGAWPLAARGPKQRCRGSAPDAD